MIQKIKNTILINVTGQTFTTCTNFKVYVSQIDILKEYVPSVISNTQVSFVIPATDALLFREGSCKIQMAWTDADGNPRATRVATTVVEELLSNGVYQ